MKLLIVFFVAVLCVACVAPGQTAEQPTAIATPTNVPTAVASCQDLATAYIKQVEPLAREWQDAATLADNTPRMSLASQVEKLQDIQRRSEGLVAPECATTVQQSFVGQMGATTRAFVAFLGQQPQTTVDDLFVVAREQQAIFKAEFPHLKDGKPITKLKPSFTDGLGMKMATIQAPFEKSGQTFKQRALADGSTASDATTDDNLTTIELIGTADKVQKVFFVSTMTGSSQARVDTIKASMHQVLQIATPDWEEGSVWLDTAIGKNKAGRQVIANRGRVIAYGFESIGGNDTYTLSIEVP